MNELKPKQGETNVAKLKKCIVISVSCTTDTRLLLQHTIKLPFSCFHNHENNQATQSLHCYLILMSTNNNKNKTKILLLPTSLVC